MFSMFFGFSGTLSRLSFSTLVGSNAASMWAFVALGKPGAETKGQRIRFTVNEHSQGAHSCDEMARGYRQNAGRIYACGVTTLH
jgi:hypothetical protein